MIERLDQALGAAPEPIVAYRPAPDIAAECLLEYPIQRREAVEQALGPLIEQAAAALAAGGQGALQLQCELSCETGERLPLVLALFEASAAPRRWFELAKLQLEQVRLPEPISAVRLSVLSAAPLVARQQELFADERPYSSDSDRRQLALSIDRLSSRLRREAVSRAVLTPDAQPEYAYRYEPLTGVGPRRKPASKTASTVHDLVAFARSQNILCQGRGSAANSAVCYCLKITAVNPNEMEMLFERFISRERKEAPDIDVDFEHERREEVIQYLYDKYGRQRAGMTAEVITYRPRSAVRDVGKTLGLSLDRIDKLAKTLEHHSLDQLEPCCRMAGIDPASRVGQQLVTLTGQLVGFPRHLGQHVGGMVMTRGPLCELVPIENASMPDRTVIEWDKNDLDELGMLKVDCLALGMLTAIHRSFDLIEQHAGRRLTLASIPVDDPPVYEMIRRADTLGVFQIESRAQMSMLPRLKPERFYDLVIEIAIVRPGPIQGNMVHPYLRRRSGEEPVEYPSDAIRSVLEKTLGVPLFQEQVMRLAMVAGFSASEADQLRRAVSGWRSSGPSARAAPK